MILCCRYMLKSWNEFQFKSILWILWSVDKSIPKTLLWWLSVNSLIAKKIKNHTSIQFGTFKVISEWTSGMLPLKFKACYLLSPSLFCWLGVIYFWAWPSPWVLYAKFKFLFCFMYLLYSIAIKSKTHIPNHWFIEWTINTCLKCTFSCSVVSEWQLLQFDISS